LRNVGFGQSLPKWGVRATSALPSIAIGQQTSRIGSFVPKAVLVMQADTFRRVSLLHLSSQFYGVEIGQVCDEPLELRGGALLPESCETVTSRSTATTLKRCSSKPKLIARPSPCAAPVIRTVRFWRRKASIHFVAFIDRCVLNAQRHLLRGAQRGRRRVQRRRQLPDIDLLPRVLVVAHEVTASRTTKYLGVLGTRG
jgi:hypothetical protein